MNLRSQRPFISMAAFVDASPDLQPMFGWWKYPIPRLFLNVCLGAVYVFRAEIVLEDS